MLKIANEDGQLFETSGLFFDQKNEWFIPNKIAFTDPRRFLAGG
jgi:hypothetical protein